MTQEWRSLAEAGQQLLGVFALGTAVVCVGAALALLWQRGGPAADTPRATYYVGHRDGSGVAVYVVTRNHVDRLERGIGAETEALAAAMLRHHTRLHDPPQWQLGALRMWLEMQPQDGFVLENVELAQIVGSPLAGGLAT